MIVAAAFLLAGAGSLALIARELRKAPEGYEDDHGFHTVHQDSGGQVKAKKWPLNQRRLLPAISWFPAA
jgi:hypothetical protein